MNLVLASVFNSYKHQIANEAIIFSQVRKKNLERCFELTDKNHDGRIEISELSQLFINPNLIQKKKFRISSNQN